MTFENQQTVQNPSKQEQVNGAEKNGTENVDCVKKATRLKGPEWNYDCTDLKCGPLNWLKEYGSSESGRSQSPVEIWIEDALKVSLNENCFHFVNYHKHFGGKIENTGRSVQFTSDTQVEPPEISGGMLDQSYRFVQYHFHWAQNDNEGSEHTVNGIRYPVELHLVHKGVQDPSKFAVLGVFLKVSEEQQQMSNTDKPFSEEEVKAFRQVLKYPKKANVLFAKELIAKLPAASKFVQKTKIDKGNSFAAPYFRYNGSLTTPPCSENVTWTVFMDPVSISRDELKILRAVEDCSGKVIEKNYRQVQNLGSRKIIFASDN